MTERIETFDVEFEVEEGDSSAVTVTVDARHIPSIKLLVLELVALHDEMRVGASPFADRLGNALQRFGIEEADE